MILDVHPFLKNFTKSGMYNHLPPQMLSKKEKERDKDKHGVSNWQKRNMDAFESIAIIQYFENKKLIDNERLLNGEFLEHEYFDDDEDSVMGDSLQDFSEPLQMLIEKGRLPRFTKHYDMFRSVIETQVSEFNNLPDSFSVVGKGEAILNDKMQMQADLLKEYVDYRLEQSVQELLRKNKIQPPSEFASEEEVQAYQQQVEQFRQIRTPKDIGMYMKMNPRHHFENWGEEELKNQVERFNLKKLRREEFRDYITVGRRFRYIRTTPFGLSIEPLNYLNVFYHKAKEIEYIQEGDYAGKISLGTASYIIDRFGHLMTQAQIETFEIAALTQYKESRKQQDLMGNPVRYIDVDGNPYNTFLPTRSAVLNRVAPNLGMNWLNYGSILGEEYTTNQIFGSRLYIITEAFWKSYEDVGRLCWNNPDTGIFEVIEVSEDFIVPPYIKVLSNHSMANEPELNTIVWMKRTVVMQGIKINNNTMGENGSGIYLAIKKCDFQQTSKNRIHKQLPIFGQIANNRNTKSVSQVDLIKPYQFLYNVVMNKAFKVLERSILPFIAADLKLLPNGEGWDGDEALIKWIEMGNDSGVVPIDTAPQNTHGGQVGGQFPKVVDIDTTVRITAYFNIAAGIRLLGLGVVGFTPERQGDVSGVDTATGIEVSVAKSFASSASWFDNFYAAEKEILTYQLEVAQWLQENNKDYSAQFTSSLYSQSFLQTNFQKLTMYDLSVYVTNSQEELRKLELFRKLAVENNTILTSMSSRMQMSTMTNAQRIIEIIKMEEEKAQQMQQKAQEMQERQANAANEIEREKLRLENEQFYAGLENQKVVAWIKSRGFVAPGEQDLDNSQIPDAFEYEKFQSEASHKAQQLDLGNKQLALEREKEANRQKEKQQELQLKKEDIIQSGINSQIMGDKGH